MASPKDPSLPWRLLAAEFVGTGLLMLFGLSLVIVMFGAGGPGEAILPDVNVRRVLTGFLFGGLGSTIALSPVGKVSGAHLNPVVTLAFWLARRLESRVALGYIGAQLAGATAGSVPLLVWGTLGASIAFGATTPGAGYTTGMALLGEIATTSGLIGGLCLFLAFRTLRPYTPALFPFLYAFMNYVDAAISGTSTNPARSLGPSIISGEWTGWWIYWVGPVCGTLLALVVCLRLARRIQVAKLYHFDNDPEGVFRRWKHRRRLAGRLRSPLDARRAGRSS
jgi:aquaporin Z